MAELAMMADIQQTVYDKVICQLHVTVQVYAISQFGMAKVSQTVEFVANNVSFSVFFLLNMFFIVFAVICHIIVCSFINNNEQIKCLHFDRHTLTSWPVTSATHIDMTHYHNEPTLVLLLADREIMYSHRDWLLQKSYHAKTSVSQISSLVLSILQTNIDTTWSFAVSGPTIWNTLPSTLRVSTTTLGQFQSGLKTILFRLAYGTCLGAFVTV